MSKQKERTLDELRQTKDSVYTQPNNSDKVVNCGIDWIKIEEIDDCNTSRNIMIWEENLSDPVCSRFQRGDYFEGLIQVYPHNSSAYYEKKKNYISYDLEGDRCQITHFAFVDSPNKD